MELKAESKWRPDVMGTSQLTRLAALDLAEEGHDSPTPRARTPGEMEYSHLGSLKLGSLRIANGAPSPAPSAILGRRRSNPDLSQEEDYFTASETCESPIMMRPTRRRGHARSKSALQPTTPPLYRGSRLSNQARKAKTTSRCDSPLKGEAQNHYLYEEPEPEPMRRLRVMNKSADTLTRDYQAEIPQSPFETSNRVDAKDHDEGFVSDDGLSFREQAFRILDGTIFAEPAATENATTNESQRETVRPDSTSRTSTEKRRMRGKVGIRPPPKKADSGYSSGGSFRIVQQGASKEGTVPIVSQKPPIVADEHQSGTGSDGDDATSLYTFEQMLRLPISQKPLPPVPASEDIRRPPISLLIPDAPENGNAVANSPGPVSRALNVSSAANSSPRTPVSVVSQFSIDSKASSQRRLQKRRPSFQALPVVQSCDPPDGTIPDIPTNVRSQFVRRLSETPGMECLTRTYPSKDHVNDDESTVNLPVVAIEFPSPPASDERRGRHHRRSATERPASPPPRGIRRSLSLFRRKSTVVKNEKEPEREAEIAGPGVVHLGTIATSLRRSPYDAAMATVPAKKVISPTHPHQLGNALPRAQSMVNMDARTAAELARLRSKDRTLAAPKMPQRPRSFHDMNLEAGEGAAFRQRPHSLHNNVPSVPRGRSDGPYPPSAPMPGDAAEHPAAGEASGPSFRARSTGRGVVVSQLIDKYDQYGQRGEVGENQEWEQHARLWNQRRKSISEGLRQWAVETEAMSSASDRSATMSQAFERTGAIDRYGGGLDYGYEGRGYGVGGSAGTRQLHSYASRKSMHFSSRYGVDLSDVPVFVQRA